MCSLSNMISLTPNRWDSSVLNAGVILNTRRSRKRDIAVIDEPHRFIYHPHVAHWLKGRMFKVTPAFNTELCQRFGVRELIFDGEHDASFHEFDTRDHRHMEYVNDRGWFADPPIAQLLRELRASYPKLAALSASRDFVSDPVFSGTL